MLIGGVFDVFYAGGVPQLPQPGKYQLRLSRKHIQVLIPASRNKLKIPAAKIQGVKLDYEIKDSQLSAGKAIAGGIIAGGIGAIAGASMGDTKAVPTLHISFTDEQGNDQVISLTQRSWTPGGKLEVAQNKMTKRYNLAH